MLSNHLQSGIETAKLVWSRLPTTEDAEAEELARAVLANGGTESLDYEVFENYAYREAQAQRGKLFVWYYVMVKWVFSLLVGIGTGLAAVFINLAVENFSGWKYAVTFAIIQHSYFAGFLVYILFNLGLVFSSVFIVTQFAPAAAGSGIPEIKGYLNGVDTHGILLFRTLIGKIFGSIGSVGGGLALGKEGPLVHTGACIASLLGQGGSTKYHIRSRWLRIFESDRDRRDLMDQYPGWNFFAPGGRGYYTCPLSAEESQGSPSQMPLCSQDTGNIPLSQVENNDLVEVDAARVSKKEKEKKKKGKGKGSPNLRWTKEMDDCLIKFLAEKAKEGFKVDKTFKKVALVAAASEVSKKCGDHVTIDNLINH